MSREEDKRLYDQKKCLFMGEVINTSFGCDEDFITSKLTACRTSSELESIENALFDTARTLDGIATERKAEGEPESTTFSDTLAETVDKVKAERLMDEKKGCLTWFNPCMDIVSASELQDKKLPPMRWLIDNLLPVGGAVMVSAKPKMGKSFLATQLALAVASGDKFLGFQARRNDVLYIDFEMGERMMQERISMFTDTAPSGLWLMCPSEPHKFGSVGGGFERQVEFALEIHKDIRLVIVDTYRIIQGARKQNENAYHVEYGEVSRLNSWARKKGVTLVLIHHQNKNDDYENPILGISGSTGITAGLQAYYILTKRNYTDEVTKLTIGGKEIRERDILIKPESDTNRMWVETEPEDRPSRKTTVNTHDITKTISKLGTGVEEFDVTAKELAEETQLTPKDIGQWLRNYEGDLEEYQGITFTRKRTKHGTVYRFKFQL